MRLLLPANAGTGAGRGRHALGLVSEWVAHECGWVLLRGSPGVAHGLLRGCDCRSRCSQPNWRSAMSDHTYRVTEIVGSSPESLQQAIRNGVARAGQTLRNLEWFEVSEIRGQIADGAVAQFQVGLKVGFRLDDPS